MQKKNRTKQNITPCETIKTTYNKKKTNPVAKKQNLAKTIKPITIFFARKI